MTKEAAILLITEVVKESVGKGLVFKYGKAEAMLYLIGLIGVEKFERYFAEMHDDDVVRVAEVIKIVIDSVVEV